MKQFSVLQSALQSALKSPRTGNNLPLSHTTPVASVAGIKRKNIEDNDTRNKKQVATVSDEKKLKQIWHAHQDANQIIEKLKQAQTDITLQALQIFEGDDFANKHKLKEFVTANPQKWSQFSVHEMENIVNQFDDAKTNDDINHYIENIATNSTQLISGGNKISFKQIRTANDVREKAEVAKNAIRMIHNAFSSSECKRKYTRLTRDAKDHILNLMIANNENLWFKNRESNKCLANTILAFQTGNKQFTDFIKKDTNAWLKLSHPRMTETIKAINMNNKQLIDFITHDDNHWYDLKQHDMFDFINVFQTHNENYINFFIQNRENKGLFNSNRINVTLDVFTRITNQNVREVIETKDKLIHDVENNLHDWFLSPAPIMTNIIAHYRSNEDSSATLLNDKQSIHNPTISRDTDRNVRYLLSKMRVPSEEESQQIFNNYKDDLSNKNDKSNEENNALMFMHHQHFRSPSKIQNITLKQLFALTLKSADQNNIEWDENIQFGSKLKNDIKQLLIVALDDSQNAYDNRGASCWAGTVNRIALIPQYLINFQSDNNWSPSKDIHINEANKNLGYILEYIAHKDRTKINDQNLTDTLNQNIKKFKSSKGKSSQDNIVEDIYPYIRNTLLSLNKRAYPNVPHFIHTIQLKENFDPYIEYYEYIGTKEEQKKVAINFEKEQTRKPTELEIRQEMNKIMQEKIYKALLR